MGNLRAGIISESAASNNQTPVNLTEATVEDISEEEAAFIGESVEHRRCGRGRTPGTPNRTTEDRKAIGELAAVVGSSTAANLTGSSQSQAHSYSKGFRTSGHRLPDAELGNAAVNSIESVKERAIEKIMTAMGLIDEDKLNNQTPIALSQIAANLSKIPGNLENKKSDINQTNQATLVIMTPPMADESNYKTIKIA